MTKRGANLRKTRWSLFSVVLIKTFDPRDGESSGPIGGWLLRRSASPERAEAFQRISKTSAGCHGEMAGARLPR